MSWHMTAVSGISAFSYPPSATGYRSATIPPKTLFLAAAARGFASIYQGAQDWSIDLQRRRLSLYNAAIVTRTPLNHPKSVAVFRTSLHSKLGVKYLVSSTMTRRTA